MNYPLHSQDWIITMINFNILDERRYTLSSYPANGARLLYDVTGIQDIVPTESSVHRLEEWFLYFLKTDPYLPIIFTGQDKSARQIKLLLSTLLRLTPLNRVEGYVEGESIHVDTYIPTR